LHVNYCKEIWSGIRKISTDDDNNDNNNNDNIFVQATTYAFMTDKRSCDMEIHITTEGDQLIPHDEEDDDWGEEFEEIDPHEKIQVKKRNFLFFVFCFLFLICSPMIQLTFHLLFKITTRIPSKHILLLAISSAE